MSVRLGPMPKQIVEGARNAGLATTLAEFGVNSAVEKPIGTELLERVAASEPIAPKLHAIQDAHWPVQFSHVIQAAQPFVAAIIAHTWFRLRADDRQTADSPFGFFVLAFIPKGSSYKGCVTGILVGWLSPK